MLLLSVREDLFCPAYMMISGILLLYMPDYVKISRNRLQHSRIRRKIYKEIKP